MPEIQTGLFLTFGISQKSYDLIDYRILLSSFIFLVGRKGSICAWRRPRPARTVGQPNCQTRLLCRVFPLSAIIAPALEFSDSMYTCVEGITACCPVCMNYFILWSCSCYETGQEVGNRNRGGLRHCSSFSVSKLTDSMGKRQRLQRAGKNSSRDLCSTHHPDDR